MLQKLRTTLIKLYLIPWIVIGWIAGVLYQAGKLALEAVKVGFGVGSGE